MGISPMSDKGDSAAHPYTISILYDTITRIPLSIRSPPQTMLRLCSESASWEHVARGDHVDRLPFNLLLSIAC